MSRRPPDQTPSEPSEPVRSDPLTFDPEATGDGLGKREQNKAEKRRRIVEAAEALFREKGFDNTTTAEISAAAGVGTGTLYLYVDSKEDLLVAVFRVEVGRAWEAAFARVDPDAPLVDQLLTLFGHMADYHLEDQVLAKAYFREMMFAKGEVARSIGSFVRVVMYRLEELVDTAQVRGELVADVDPVVVARNLFAIWYFEMQRVLGREAENWASIERSIRTALSHLVNPVAEET